MPLPLAARCLLVAVARAVGVAQPGDIYPGQVAGTLGRRKELGLRRTGGFPLLPQRLCKSLQSGGGAEQAPTFTPARSPPVGDGIVGAAHLEQLLQEQIEVHGKAGNHSGGIRSLEKSKSKISATSEVPSFKRYLKYLTKKNLKNRLRDWLCVVATGQESFELR